MRQKPPGSTVTPFRFEACLRNLPHADDDDADDDDADDDAVLCFRFRNTLCFFFLCHVGSAFQVVFVFLLDNVTYRNICVCLKTLNH